MKYIHRSLASLSIRITLFLPVAFPIAAVTDPQQRHGCKQPSFIILQLRRSSVWQRSYWTKIRVLLRHGPFWRLWGGPVSLLFRASSGCPHSLALFLCLQTQQHLSDPSFAARSSSLPTASKGSLLLRDHLHMSESWTLITSSEVPFVIQGHLFVGSRDWGTDIFGLPLFCLPHFPPKVTIWSFFNVSFHCLFLKM